MREPCRLVGGLYLVDLRRSNVNATDYRPVAGHRRRNRAGVCEWWFDGSLSDLQRPAAIYVDFAAAAQ